MLLEFQKETKAHQVGNILEKPLQISEIVFHINSTSRLAAEIITLGES